MLAKSLILLEAAIGFEPMNNGFADRCLSLLAMPPVSRPLQNALFCPISAPAP